MSRYVVGAYAASPAAAAVWDERLEDEFYTALAQDPRIAALELPWQGALHPHDEEWLFAHLPPTFDAVLTDIAHVYLTGLKRPGLGLASADEEGRTAAMRDVRRLRDDVLRLNDRLGRRAVQAVELHAGPRGNRAAVPALERSLAELGRWDWDDAELVLEHCDALVPGHAPEKGFLALADELDAMRRSGADVGAALNWGRSAIELRDPDRVVEHVALARDSGRLRGLVFSGASDQAGYASRPWSDVHNAFRRSAAHPDGDPSSLLTDERARAVVGAVTGKAWLGVKLWWPPAVSGSVAERAAMIVAALDALDSARSRDAPDNRLEQGSTVQRTRADIQR